MKIGEYVASIDNYEKFFELNELLDKKSTPTVSFLGLRGVTVEGYTGSISLEELKEKASHISSSKILSLGDRVAGINCMKHLQTLHSRADAKIHPLNIVTRFFCGIRDYLSYFRESSKDDYFRRYLEKASPAEYDEIAEIPNAVESSANCFDREYGQQMGIIASETAILTLAKQKGIIK